MKSAVKPMGKKFFAATISVYSVIYCHLNNEHTQ